MHTLTRIVQLVVSIAVSIAAGSIGSIATTPNIPTWYAALEKPPLLPPSDVFGPVWGVLYALIGLALFLVWIAPKQRHGRVYIAFFVQLSLNAAWSWAFFGLQQPWLGVVVITLLIGAIIWTMVEFRKVSRPAVWLMAPYLAWVVFASYLTVGVALLN